MTVATATPSITIRYLPRSDSVCVQKDGGRLRRELVRLVGQFHQMFRARLGRVLPAQLPNSVESELDAFWIFAIFETVSRLYAGTNGRSRRDKRLVSPPTLDAGVVWRCVEAGQGVELVRQLLDGSLCPADRQAVAQQLLAVLQAHWTEVQDQNRRPTFYRRPGVVTFSLNEKGVVEAKFTSMTTSPTIEIWVRLHERQLRTYLAPRGNTNACVATH